MTLPPRQGLSADLERTNFHFSPSVELRMDTISTWISTRQQWKGKFHLVCPRHLLCCCWCKLFADSQHPEARHRDTRGPERPSQDAIEGTGQAQRNSEGGRQQVGRCNHSQLPTLSPTPVNMHCAIFFRILRPWQNTEPRSITNTTLCTKCGGAGHISSDCKYTR